MGVGGVGIQWVYCCHGAEGSNEVGGGLLRVFSWFG